MQFDVRHISVIEVFFLQLGIRLGHQRGLAIANRLHTGMIHVNDQTVNNEFHVPFGGMGASGNGGRFGGLVYIEEITQSQRISVMDRPIAYPF